MKLKVKAVPGSSRDEIAGWLGDALKVRVTAPPEQGSANKAIARLVAGSLGIPASRVRVGSGASSPRKTLEIDGLAESDVLARLPPR